MESTVFWSRKMSGYWDHKISIIVTSILTDLTMFQRKLVLSTGSLLIMEIMAIHSWKSQYIHICMVFGYDQLCDLLEMLNFNKYRSTVATHRNLVESTQFSRGI
jgi:hypothetical protein